MVVGRRRQFSTDNCYVAIHHRGTRVVQVTVEIQIGCPDVAGLHRNGTRSIRVLGFEILSCGIGKCYLSHTCIATLLHLRNKFSLYVYRLVGGTGNVSERSGQVYLISTDATDEERLFLWCGIVTKIDGGRIGTTFPS